MVAAAITNVPALGFFLYRNVQQAAGLRLKPDWLEQGLGEVDAQLNNALLHETLGLVHLSCA